ncbi:hypothetical protein DXG03_001096 [Asterophora parasitica]|uniref:Uncharacterized protein n=1 Tax=Asterophora parasitica TaxID=117018 RepID=A0A9P7KCQ2_9AGAR|nr:hypothetical protein DXG03_001096 [Asterophora parasitica]
MLVLPHRTRSTTLPSLVNTPMSAAQKPKPQQPLTTFALPDFKNGTAVMIQSCARLNLTPSGKAYSSLNYTPVADDMVLALQVQLYSTSESVHGDFAMFAHRGRLRQMAERARSGEGKSAVVGADTDIDAAAGEHVYWYGQEDDEARDGDEDDSHQMDTNTNTSATAPADSILRVPWARWGPRTTRWVDACGGHLDWTTCSWGARSILGFYHSTKFEPEEDVDDGWCEDRWFHVYDFNPYTVRKYRSTGGDRVDSAAVEREWGGGRGGGAGGAMYVEVVEDLIMLDGGVGCHLCASRCARQVGRREGRREPGRGQGWKLGKSSRRRA